MLGALGAQGLQAVMTVEGATDAEVFRTSVKRVLGPTLRPGNIVVMDNLRVRKAVGVQQALARRTPRRGQPGTAPTNVGGGVSPYAVHSRMSPSGFPPTSRTTQCLPPLFREIIRKVKQICDSLHILKF
jgi:DDE superfamily endonuclease